MARREFRLCELLHVRSPYHRLTSEVFEAEAKHVRGDQP